MTLIPNRVHHHHHHQHHGEYGDDDDNDGSDGGDRNWRVSKVFLFSEGGFKEL